MLPQARLRLRPLASVSPGPSLRGRFWRTTELPDRRCESVLGPKKKKEHPNGTARDWASESRFYTKKAESLQWSKLTFPTITSTSSPNSQMQEDDAEDGLSPVSEDDAELVRLLCEGHSQGDGSPISFLAQLDGIKKASPSTSPTWSSFTPTSVESQPAGNSVSGITPEAVDDFERFAHVYPRRGHELSHVYGQFVAAAQCQQTGSELTSLLLDAAAGLSIPPLGFTRVLDDPEFEKQPLPTIGSPLRKIRDTRMKKKRDRLQIKHVEVVFEKCTSLITYMLRNIAQLPSPPSSSSTSSSSTSSSSSIGEGPALKKQRA
jgi:hypothetical protein